MININLKEMDLATLKELLANVKSEIDSRSEAKELAIYRHNCKEASKHHLGKYKHWAKLIKAVDTTKTNGYAFTGDFLSVQAEHKLPVDSIIVEVCNHTVILYKLTADGKEEIIRATTNTMSDLIEKAAELV